MKISYDIYEDNGGGIHMIISTDEGSHVFTGLEYISEPGVVLDMIAQLREDPAAWKMWDGWDGEEPENDVIEWIEEHDDLIAWGENGAIKTVGYDRMGCAGRDALALSEPEEE